jgi:hypothetical protein
MPGIGEEMVMAMQHAPQPGRHAMWPLSALVGMGERMNPILRISQAPRRPLRRAAASRRRCFSEAALRAA